MARKTQQPAGGLADVIAIAIRRPLQLSGETHAVTQCVVRCKVWSSYPAFTTIERLKAPGNVHVYKEMPFRETLPFIKHADFGIAAYRPIEKSEYLSQSSLKLMQYEYLGIPAVCPEYAVGDSPSRLGYSPGDLTTIDNAIEGALGQKPARNKAKVMTWNDIARRLLNPELFEDTAIEA